MLIVAVGLLDVRFPFYECSKATGSDVASLQLISTFADLMIFTDSLIMVITYVWSRKNAESVVNIYGMY